MNDLDFLRTEYKSEMKKMNSLAYGSLLIFGIPALFVVWIGDFLIAQGYETQPVYTTLILCALGISSLIFYAIFARVQKKISDLEDRIRMEVNKGGNK